MKIFPLCSSSKGNCTYIGTQNAGILVDAGMSFQYIKRTLASIDVDPAAVRAIFITHEHSDHISGLRVFLKSYPVPVFASRGTLLQLLKKGVVQSENSLYQMKDQPVTVAGLEVVAFHTPHDSADSLCYTLFDGKKRASICTDLGKMPPSVFSQLRRCDFVMLESNYDPHLLSFCRYPAYIKERIRSEYGHLSNQESARQIVALVQSGVEKFLLAHLSFHSNAPEVALENLHVALSQNGIRWQKDCYAAVAPLLSDGRMYEL